MVLALIILAFVLIAVVYSVEALSRPAQGTITSTVYVECGGNTFNLSQNPLACDIIPSGMQDCYKTITTNGTKVIEITPVQQNQSCT